VDSETIGDKLKMQMRIRKIITATLFRGEAMRGGKSRPRRGFPGVVYWAFPTFRAGILGYSIHNYIAILSAERRTFFAAALLPAEERP
jgi:hypothetical protein